MKYTMTDRECREHQQLIRDNIADAERMGDTQRAEMLRKVFAPMLAIEFPEPEPLLTIGEVLAMSAKAQKGKVV